MVYKNVRDRARSDVPGPEPLTTSATSLLGNILQDKQILHIYSVLINNIAFTVLIWLPFYVKSSFFWIPGGQHVTTVQSYHKLDIMNYNNFPKSLS